MEAFPKKKNVTRRELREMVFFILQYCYDAREIPGSEKTSTFFYICLAIFFYVHIVVIINKQKI